MLFLLAASCGHVPTYVGGEDNCFTPPHHHDTSQVIYLKGSGGLEIHLDTLSSPIDVLGHEVLDVDAVFRDEVDQSSYSLYIGCGGCVASEDPVVVPPLQLHGYGKGDIEPFTQGRYYTALTAEQKLFNSSALASCSQMHFTIRLVDHGRVDGSEIIWGAVVGKGESFTVQETLLFAYYIVRNHGGTWNLMGWTLPFSFLVAFAVIQMERARNQNRGRRVRASFVDWTKGCACPFKLLPAVKWPIPTTPISASDVLYDLAVHAFLFAAVEELWHLFYFQLTIPLHYGLWIGTGIVLVSQFLPLAIVRFIWDTRSSHVEPLPDHKSPAVQSWLLEGSKCRASCLKCGSSALWAFLGLPLGVGLLFNFGSGLYVGPACVILASLFRMAEVCSPQPSPAAEKGVFEEALSAETSAMFAPLYLNI
jgi:hypothetical protein